MKLFGALVWVALLAVVLAIGCGQGSQKEETETTGSSSTTPESQTRQETTYEEKTPDKETTGASFTAVPEMSGGSERAADSIQGVRFESSEGYERAIIDFGSEAPPLHRFLPGL